MNPELYGYMMNKLFELGASDVYFTPIIMKKSRPAIKLTVLSSSERLNKIEECILKETTTLGIRKYSVDKVMLEREIQKIQTKYGEVRVKNAYYDGEIIKSKPEYEDCKNIALDKNIFMNEVYNEVYKNIRSNE